MIEIFDTLLSISKNLLIFAAENHAQNPLSCRYNITGAQQDGREEMLKWGILALGIIYMIKAFTYALFLTIGNFANFHILSKDMATVDVPIVGRITVDTSSFFVYLTLEQTIFSNKGFGSQLI